MSKAELAAAVKEAAQEAIDASAAKSDTEGTVSTETPVVDKVTAPDSQVVGNDVQVPDAEKTAASVEAFKAAWNVDLSVLPDEAAQEKFMSEWSESQKTIGKLQRDNAELRKKADETPAPVAAPAIPAPETVEVSKLTDEQIGEAIGINVAEADERDMREISLTRTILEQDERMNRLESGFAESAASTTWAKAFDQLEKDFGPLPKDTERVDVFEWAAENGVASPEAAYWAAVGPVRASVATALNERIIELRTDGKKGATTPRPKTSAPVDETALTAKTVKEGIKEAFNKARAELGIDINAG